ncbi:alpha/beta fold hydrolase [Paraburkholderia xenovorans]|uniref:alpha/beta fold hydrolase n=2 Tax=Paraburkholderia xenovorans TaxID=36873 RepID=UPI0038B850D8
MKSLNQEDRILLESGLLPVRTVDIETPRLGDAPLAMTYRTGGPVDAPAIVLLHGIGSSSAGYRAQLAGLQDSFRVVAWDAPGYGQSAPLRVATPGVEDYADALMGLMSALDIGTATIVGSSWGSVIAAAFENRYPEATRSLVLSAPNVARGHLQGEAKSREVEALLHAGKAMAPSDRVAMVDLLVAPDTPSAVRDHVLRLADAVTPAGWAHAVYMVFSASTPPLVAAATVPVSIVVGDRDRMAPMDEHALKLHTAAPASILHVLEDIGHVPKLEAPARFNQILRNAARVADS